MSKTNTNYDFSQFFDNGEYNNIVWDKGVTNTSIPYSQNFDAQAKNYYTNWTGTGSSNLENSYEPYTAFTNYVTQGIRNKDKGVYKYLNWLLNKTSKDGIEGGAENLRIGTDLNNIWDATTGDFKSGINWDDEAIKNSVENIINRYSARRKDGKFGWYHLGPKTLSNSKIPEVKKVPESNYTIDSYTPYKAPDEEFKPAKFRFPGWSDYIPLTAKKIADDISAMKATDLDSKKIFPKIQPAYRQQEVTNAYAQNQMLENEKNDLLQRAAAMDGSDINQNLRQRIAAQEQAQKYTQTQMANMENETNQTRREWNSIQDWNTQQSVNSANFNRKVDAAAFNDLLDTIKTKILSLTNNFNTWTRDMYTNFGEYLKTKRLNEDGLTKANAYAKYSFDANRAYDQYYKVVEDKAYWPGYNQLINDLLSGDTHDPKIGEFRDKVLKGELVQGTPEFKQAIDQILTSTTEPLIVRQKNAYTAYVDKIQKQAENMAQKAGVDYSRTIASIPTFQTNQWGYPLPYSRSSYMKSGGKMDRFSDFAKLIQKEQESVRTNTNNYHKRASTEYDKQVGRISREQLSLLMAIFK